MDLGSLFIIMAILVLVGLFVSRPFFESVRTVSKTMVLDDASITKEDHEFSALMAERDRIVDALQELDFDATLGKIPQEDYPLQREKLIQNGASVLRQLDDFSPEKTHQSPLTDLNQVDEFESKLIQMEEMVSGTKKPGAPSDYSRPNASSDDDIESLIANRKRERQGKASGFCPHCGGALQKKDKFCPKCGMRIA